MDLQLFSHTELTIIIISSVVGTGSISVEAAKCLNCLGCDMALLSQRTKCFSFGSLSVCRLYLLTISSIGPDDMFFLNCSCLSSLLRLWSSVVCPYWGLSILGGHLELDTVSPQSSLSPDTAINCWLFNRRVMAIYKSDAKQESYQDPNTRLDGGSSNEYPWKGKWMGDLWRTIITLQSAMLTEQEILLKVLHIRENVTHF